MSLYQLSSFFVPSVLYSVSYNFAFSVSHYDGTTLCNYSVLFAYAGENGFSTFWGSLKNHCCPSNLFLVIGLLCVRLLKKHICLSSCWTKTKGMIYDCAIWILCISIRYLLHVVVLFPFYKPGMLQLCVWCG